MPSKKHSHSLLRFHLSMLRYQLCGFEDASMITKRFVVSENQNTTEHDSNLLKSWEKHMLNGISTMNNNYVNLFPSKP